VKEPHRQTTPPASDIADEDDIAFEDSTDLKSQAAGAPDLLLGSLSQFGGVLREGLIYTISLANFRERLGAQWPRLRLRIREGVENTLNDRLHSHDVFLPAGDDTYVISYAGGNAAHAALATAKIARAIKEKLFGDADVEVTVAMLTQPILDSVVSQTAHRRMADVVHHRQLVSHRFAQVSALREITYIFTPVWDAVHKVLSTYVCTPTQRTRAGIQQYGSELLANDASDIERAEFCARTLEFALEVAEDLYANQFAVFISVQCDYLALSSPRSRDIYFAMCRRIPVHLKKFLRVQVIGVDDTVPTTTLTERIGNLKPYFQLITLRLGALDQHISRFAFMGLHALSFPVSPVAGFDFDRAIAMIRQARDARLHVAFTRVGDLATADRLAVMGATYLSGKFLGEALDAPENMTRCTLEDLGRMNR